MRIAFDDALYGLLQGQGRTVEVWLDGIKQDRVVSADEEKGQIVRYAADARGEIRVSCGEAVKETVRGKVQIEIVRIESVRTDQLSNGDARR